MLTGECLASRDRSNSDDRKAARVHQVARCHSLQPEIFDAAHWMSWTRTEEMLQLTPARGCTLTARQRVCSRGRIPLGALNLGLGGSTGQRLRDKFRLESVSLTQQHQQAEHSARARRSSTWAGLERGAGSAERHTEPSTAHRVAASRPESCRTSPPRIEIDSRGIHCRSASGSRGGYAYARSYEYLAPGGKVPAFSAESLPIFPSERPHAERHRPVGVWNRSAYASVFAQLERSARFMKADRGEFFLVTDEPTHPESAGGSDAHEGGGQ